MLGTVYLSKPISELPQKKPRETHQPELLWRFKVLLCVQAIQAAIYKESAADSWANEGKKHSDLLIEACIAAEQVLYKHRSLTPKRRRGRLIGPLDLACLPEREAIEALESEVALHTTRRQRSPRLGADQPISILLTSPKVPPPSYTHPPPPPPRHTPIHQHAGNSSFSLECI